VTATYRSNIHRLPLSAFSEWPTIHVVVMVNAAPSGEIHRVAAIYRYFQNSTRPTL
jgi:hypothetical protein